MGILKRFAVLVVGLIALQSVVFAYWYRDLLRLRRPAPALAVDRQEFDATALRALSREDLTRTHLETIAAGASLARNLDAEQEALRRLVELSPDDDRLRLRYAEALRLGGRFDDAQREYTTILAHTHSAGERR
jgi:hypothetical protein